MADLEPRELSVEPASRRSPISVSVVMPVLDAEATLDVQLEALARQDFDEPWEIVVVDNGSVDDTRAILETWRARLTNLRVIGEPRRGVNRARNTGVVAAVAGRILLCDADDVVDEGWVRALASALDEYDLVAGRLEYDLLNSDEVRARSQARPLAEGLAAVWRRPWGMTCNLGFRRTVFDALDGFDPAFERGGSDDVDFCLRAGAAGITLGFSGDAVVHYRLRADAREQGAEQLYKKHLVLGELDAYPPRTRWNQSASRAAHLVLDIPSLGSRTGRERYVGRAAKLAGGVTGLWRHQVRGVRIRTVARSTATRATIWLTPHGVMARHRTRQRAEIEAKRRARYEAARAATAGPHEPIRDYEALLGLAVDAGVDPELVRIGSIPADSLDFILDRIEGGPGLHIGNYAGLSLAYVAAHTDGIVVAVDPNVEHWGLPNPQDVVVRLLQAAGVDDRVLLVCGYSLEKNPGNDGSIIAGFDPSVEYRHEAAPVGVLQILRSFGVRFRWVVLDGNHDPAYLRAELEQLRPLLTDDGVAFLDDCDQYWPDIRAIFENARDGWRADGNDHRIGVLRRTAATRARR